MLAGFCLALCAAPAPLQEEAPLPHFRFVVVGHVRGGPGDGVIPQNRLRELVTEIDRLEPELVFVLGDLVYGSWQEVPDADAIRADWDAIDAELARTDAAVHRVPGNHDAWDPVTRDIWVERYGPLYQSVEHEGVLFLLLQSGWVPAPGDDGWCPGKYTRGAPMEPDQIDFVHAELERRGREPSSWDLAHVFVMMHHLLWWEYPEQWWAELHPLLAGGPTRAVFAGDLGPWKFSHEERDGIEYVQTSVEFTVPPLEMLRNREGSRVISSQLDNFVVVDVDGPDVTYDVRTLGAMTTGRLSSTVWRAVNGYDEGTLRRKVFDRWSTPERMRSGVLVAVACAFLAGVLATAVPWLLLRSRRLRSKEGEA